MLFAKEDENCHCHIGRVNSGFCYNEISLMIVKDLLMKLLHLCEAQQNPKYLKLVHTESPESNTVKIW